MDEMKRRRLQELDRSDFEIVDGEPDIRGWDVKNETGQKIGEVEDLIIDARLKKVRYMVVDLNDNDLDIKHDKVAIPIGLAELDKKEDDVILPGINAEQLKALPDYDRDKLDASVENRICEVLGRKNETMKSLTANETNPEFYKHDYFNDDNLYKHRLHQTEKPKESEYEHGLRLWERRSQGGILSDEETGRDRRNRKAVDESSEESIRERELNETERMEMVRNRRDHYKQRRHTDETDRTRDTERRHRRNNTIEGRIRDEGLRDG
jgi:sporulation protein YlmC with PRC-barrel domain